MCADSAAVMLVCVRLGGEGEGGGRDRPAEVEVGVDFVEFVCNGGGVNYVHGSGHDGSCHFVIL